MARGEREADTGEQLTDSGADFEHTQSEGVELEGFVSGGDEPAAQGVQEPVGSRVEEQAELIGDETVITEAIALAGTLEVLDPQFWRATVHIEVVEGQWLIVPGGDDEAGVWSLRQGLCVWSPGLLRACGPSTAPYHGPPFEDTGGRHRRTSCLSPRLALE